MSNARCSLKLDRVAGREEGRIGVEGGRYVRGHVHMTSALGVRGYAKIRPKAGRLHKFEKG